MYDCALMISGRGLLPKSEVADHDAKQTSQESTVGRLRLMKQPLLHGEQQEPMQQRISPEAAAL